MSDEERDDPFEALDVPDDREGDPFERLDDAGPDGTDADEGDDGPTGDSAAAPPGSADGADPAGTDAEPAFEEEFLEEGDLFPADTGTGSDGSSAGEGSGGSEDLFGGDDPFGGMDGREGDPFGEGESVFESVDVEELDADQVWESLDEEPAAASVDDSRYVEVSKHRFCEQCEHFSRPPNARCTNDEAEIIEFLDMATVRLLNCPVVAEQRQLEDEE
ncbi:hypothetical protein [Haloarcula onubensis]|uniref:DUF8135 domain-containing protein n=1 Tax=Haloarcula onubensis TaxID=2950539 RepID=A0ABU2FQN2_9EURY|nr:hypothetical protein [Halomicroarcula sp. S3CR25-11]MDS0283065.1 hypothetical protein [Halomicroarcula sp. S3CR25-11]